MDYDNNTCFVRIAAFALLWHGWTNSSAKQAQAPLSPRDRRQ